MPYKPNLRQPYPNELYHFGILGQKWGIRRFQNPDGSYTAAGKKRYNSGEGKKKEKDHKINKKEFTKTVEDAGFKKNVEYGEDVEFTKKCSNKSHPELEVAIDYEGDKKYKSSGLKKAIEKADRFAKNSNKIVTSSIDKILEDDDNYKWLAEGYAYEHPGKPTPSKSEIKQFLKPLTIDAQRGELIVDAPLMGGWFTVEFNTDTYDAKYVGYDD